MKRHILKGIIKAEDKVFCEGDFLTIADKEMPYNDLLKTHIKQLYGSTDYSHDIAYSEYTGYLWTNDEAKIGGHDLIEELTSHDTKYCYLEIDEYEVGDDTP